MVLAVGLDWVIKVFPPSVECWMVLPSLFTIQIFDWSKMKEKDIPLGTVFILVKVPVAGALSSIVFNTNPEITLLFVRFFLALDKSRYQQNQQYLH